MNENERLQELKKQLQEIQREQWVPYGVSILDDALLGIRPGDLQLLVAPTGAGKTMLATHIALNAARMGRNVFFFALECEDNEIEDRIVWNELCREWFKQYPMGKFGVDLRYRSWKKGILASEVSEIEAQVRNALRIDLTYLQTYYRQGAFYAKDFANAIDAIPDEVDLIILDHIHFFDSDETNELRALKDAIRKIRDAALKKLKPILILGQLRKLSKLDKNPLPDIDDVFGSSDLVKTATEIIISCRAEDAEVTSGNYPMWIYFPKSRTAGDIYGYAGLISYDVKQGKYSDKYVIHKAKRFKEPEELPAERIPRWAKNALVPEKSNWTPDRGKK